MKGFITRLAKIQRQASLHITGALRSAPTGAIDACVDILPFPLLIERIVFQATSWLVTLPQLHPLEWHVRRAATRYANHHRSPAHEMLHALRISPTNFETIIPCKYGSKWALCPHIQGGCIGGDGLYPQRSHCVLRWVGLEWTDRGSCGSIQRWYRARCTWKKSWQ